MNASELISESTTILSTDIKGIDALGIYTLVLYDSLGCMFTEDYIVGENSWLKKRYKNVQSIELDLTRK